jgi:hypothetical protein
MSCRGFEPVCTNDEAREYFKSKGLSYEKIHDYDLLILRYLLVKEIEKSNKTGETSVNTMRMSSKQSMTLNSDDTIQTAFLFMSSHYFENRECISFNRDGFIGIAGWADQGNLNPIKRAFLKWCDFLTDGKEITNARD